MGHAQLFSIKENVSNNEKIYHSASFFWVFLRMAKYCTVAIIVGAAPFKINWTFLGFQQKKKFIKMRLYFFGWKGLQRVINFGIFAVAICHMHCCFYFDSKALSIRRYESKSITFDASKLFLNIKFNCIELTKWNKTISSMHAIKQNGWLNNSTQLPFFFLIICVFFFSFIVVYRQTNELVLCRKHAIPLNSKTWE